MRGDRSFRRRCGHHDNCHGTESVIAIADDAGPQPGPPERDSKSKKTRVLNGCAAFSKVTNMGNYWLRLLLAVPILLQLFLDLDFENAPNDEDLADRKLICDVFGPTPVAPTTKKKKSKSQNSLAPKKSGKRRRRATAAQRYHAAKQRYAQLKVEWLTMLNTTPHSDRIGHKCGFGCGCTSPEHAFKRICRIIRHYMLGRRFRIINVKEFDGVGEGLKPQAFGILNNRILPKLWKIAMEPGKKHVRRFKDTQQDSFDQTSELLDFAMVPLHQVDSESNAFESFIEDIDWKKLAGTRINIVNEAWESVGGLC